MEEGNERGRAADPGLQDHRKSELFKTEKRLRKGGRKGDREGGMEGKRGAK